MTDELYGLWSIIERGVRILGLSDSCHSGTVTRDAVGMTDSRSLTSGPLAEILGTVNASYRFMPDVAAARTYRRNTAFYDEIQGSLPADMPELNATVRLISGCQDNQLSLDGQFNGLFTRQLLRAWSSGAFDGNYREFHKAILRRMPASQSPNHFVLGPTHTELDEEKPFQI